MCQYLIRGLAAACLLTLAACAPTLGPPPPVPPPPMPPGPPPRPPADPAAYRAADHIWSLSPGPNRIDGRFTYRARAAAYTCAGSTVVIMPESPFTIRRMQTIYGSADRAVTPSAEARRRTTSAPPADFNRFVKTSTCDQGNRFSIAGLPDGAWFVITVAKPIAGAQGEELAFMRRVVARGGRPVQVEL